MSITTEVLRTEKKYSITPYAVSGLVTTLSAAFKQDDHNQPGGYLVRSLYFDTPFDDDFADKLDGLEVRRKIRLRTYSPDAQKVKLEIKQKMGHLQKKRSVTLTRAQAQSVIEGSTDVLLTLNNQTADELYYLMQQYVYRPVCIVEYLRTAFIVDANDTRVTIDQMIRSTASNNDLFAPDLLTASANDYPILEVKYNGFLLDSVKTLTRVTGESETANSKYAMARQSCLL